MRLIRRSAGAWLVACLVAASAHAAPPQQPRAVPWELWLAEPVRRDMGWKVDFAKPRLSFDERQVLAIRLGISAARLQKSNPHRDLHLLVKAGDGTRWYPGESYTHHELLQPVDAKADLEFVTLMYVRPGKHQFGIILEDRVTGQRDVARRWITVSPLRNDPLPRLDQDMPPVDFLRVSGEGSPDAVRARRRREGNRPPDAAPRPRTQIAASEPPAALPLAERRIPIRGKRSIMIDVLVDFTPSSQFTGMTRIYRRTESVFWEITHVLSQLDPVDGCVRLTGVDVIGRRVLFERVDAGRVHWGRLAAAVAEIDAHTVDVKSLQERTEMAAFFRRQVMRLLDHIDERCPRDTSAQPPLHVYVVAASGIIFPRGTRRSPVEAITGAPSKLYYLRAHLTPFGVWDEMESIVRPLQPRVLTIDDPMQFRKALGAMITDLENETGPP